MTLNRYPSASSEPETRSEAVQLASVAASAGKGTERLLAPKCSLHTGPRVQASPFLLIIY